MTAAPRSFKNDTTIFAAQKVAEDDDDEKRGEDPRQEPGQGAQEDTPGQD